MQPMLLLIMKFQLLVLVSITVSHSGMVEIHGELSGEREVFSEFTEVITP
mgnify:CR=1 FL=1